MKRDKTEARYAFDARGSLILDNGGRMGVALAVADDPWKRFLGLMGLEGMAQGRGLLLERCSSIHMCFMRFPIDVIWLAKPDREGMRKVTGVSRDVKPWRTAFGPRGTDACIEMAAGTAPAWPGALTCAGELG